MTSDTEKKEKQTARDQKQRLKTQHFKKTIYGQSQQRIQSGFEIFQWFRMPNSISSGFIKAQREKD